MYILDMTSLCFFTNISLLIPHFRFEQDPFPLYPGEKLYGKVSPLQVVAPNAALRLRAIRDFKDGETNRVAGDEWLYEGTFLFPGKVLKRTNLCLFDNLFLFVC